MSDAYSDWCDTNMDREVESRRKDLDRHGKRIDELVDVCVKAREKADMRFVERCQTCGHQSNDRCYRLGYTYVNPLGTCGLWTRSDAVLNREDGLAEMLLPFAKRRRRS